MKEIKKQKSGSGGGGEGGEKSRVSVKASWCSSGGTEPAPTHGCPAGPHAPKGAQWEPSEQPAGTQWELRRNPRVSNEWEPKQEPHEFPMGTQ